MMSLVPIALFILLNPVQSVVTQDTAGSCVHYQFQVQPPLNLTCNPFYGSLQGDGDTAVLQYQWRLRFNCRVVRLSEDAGSFNIRWFRRSPGNDTGEAVGGLAIANTDVNEMEIVYGIVLFNKAFMDSMLGDYWCQVINTTTQPHTYLGMSNVLTILHPDQYDLALPDCGTGNGVINNETVTCADIPSNDEITVPLPSSEPSHHITMTTPGSSTNHHQVPTIATSSVHVPMHSLDHVTHSTVQPILITTSTIPTTLPPILPPSNTNTHNMLPSISASSVSVASGTCSSSNALLLHISHSLIHLILLLIIIILIAIMCLRKRLTKVVQKLPIYVEVLEATPDTMKTQSSQPATVCPIELQTNEAYNTVQSNTEAEYTPLDVNTMQPKREYAVVKMN